MLDPPVQTNSVDFTNITVTLNETNTGALITFPEGNTYVIDSGNEVGLFTISSNILYLVEGQNLDYETATRHILVIIATSNDTNTQENIVIEDTTATVTINVGDYVIYPDFNDTNVILNETNTGAFITFSEGNTYVIDTGNDAGLFTISSNILYLVEGQSLDYETANRHILVITASSNYTNTNIDEVIEDTTATVTINVELDPEVARAMACASNILSACHSNELLAKIAGRYNLDDNRDAFLDIASNTTKLANNAEFINNPGNGVNKHIQPYNYVISGEGDTITLQLNDQFRTSFLPTSADIRFNISNADISGTYTVSGDPVASRIDAMVLSGTLYDLAQAIAMQREEEENRLIISLIEDINNVIRPFNINGTTYSWDRIVGTNEVIVEGTNIVTNLSGQIINGSSFSSQGYVQIATFNNEFIYTIGRSVGPLIIQNKSPGPSTFVFDRETGYSIFLANNIGSTTIVFAQTNWERDRLIALRDFLLNPDYFIQSWYSPASISNIVPE